MHIARKTKIKETKVGNTMTVFEYPIMDNALHGAVVEFKGRYPEKGRVVNEKCYEADATMFMPCTPAWFPEQHKEIE